MRRTKVGGGVKIFRKYQILYKTEEFRLLKLQQLEGLFSRGAEREM